MVGLPFLYQSYNAGIYSVTVLSCTITSENKSHIKSAELEELQNGLNALDRKNAELKEKMLADSEENRAVVTDLHGSYSKVVDEIKLALESRISITVDEKDRKILNQQKNHIDISSKCSQRNKKDSDV
jgi:hypothetical protein